LRETVDLYDGLAFGRSPLRPSRRTPVRARDNQRLIVEHLQLDDKARVERLSDVAKLRDGHIAPTGLNPCDVGGVDVHALGQLDLREPGSASRVADCFAGQLGGEV
jgi:hypothetical protein